MVDRGRTLPRSCGGYWWVAAGCTISNIVDAKYADERIAVIEAKNSEVEAGIQAAVRNFMEHEGKTYEKMAPDEAIAYAVGYPELASNELVKEQIATYKSNREQIMQYEQLKIDAEIAKWWLYFGGKGANND